MGGFIQRMMVLWTKLNMYYIYFAKSLKNGKVYVGKTNKKPEDRVKEHNQGSNKWTKENGPFKLVYFETYIYEEDLAARESFYKTGFGNKIKKAIITVMDP